MSPANKEKKIQHKKVTLFNTFFIIIIKYFLIKQHFTFIFTMQLDKFFSMSYLIENQLFNSHSPIIPELARKNSTHFTNGGFH